MSAFPGSFSTVDLDDAEAVLAADRDGALWAASMAGAQVRATAAAVDEGALDGIRSESRDYPPRTIIWLSTRGTAATAGSLLAATRGHSARAPLVQAAEVPSWIGSLDVLIVAGDDPGDPALVAAAAAGVRRGARVVVVAPYEGPLRDATAGRVAVLEPRVVVAAEFGLPRYVAAGLAILDALEGDGGGAPTDLGALADELDAEALRNSAARELFTNPAKLLADRIVGRDIVLAGDCAATLALARHGSVAMLRVGLTPVAATGLPDAVSALRARSGGPVVDIFHDEQIDGPAADRLRVLALTLAAERTVVAARINGLHDIDLIAAADVPLTPDASEEAAGPAAAMGSKSSSGPAEQQLAVLAVRLEMAAAYVRLLRG
ncbi:TobH protein [Mycolicibacter nonchromogenicus]|uniref:TobH protein n=1 Tax=Mycolicibacter nonchromogenicus TaxID=1782 RepID=A0A1X1ZJ85_MYCNO|nr:TobH protein [Mycolicibacter nonchromogenicus]ORW23434.1 TobH protein [Mycolicibacter nonchromogenicus]